MLRIALILILIFVQQTSGLSGNDPYLNVIRDVYQDLINAIGDQRKEWPELVILDREKSVAAYRSKDNKIILERKAIDVCRSLEGRFEDALAFLISHELTHFYQQHEWVEVGFGTSFIADKATFDKKRKQEDEADIYGAFISWLAGYNTISVIPALLSKIYDSYQLEEATLGQYPPLKDRQAAAAKACEKTQNLIYLYEAGHYLLALGFYAEATDCYSSILPFIKCKELYNNLGVASLSAAVAGSTAKVRQFYYPLEIDQDFPLRKPVDVDSKALLNKAIEALIRSTQFDPSYYPAFINLASAYDLLGLYEEEEQLLGSLEKVVPDKSNLAKVKLLKGILNARKGQAQLAEQYFNEAESVEKNSYIKQLVRKNKNALKGKKAVLQAPTIFESKLGAQIDQLSLRYLPQLSFQKDIPLSKEGALFQKHLLVTELQNSIVLMYKSQGQSIAIHTTKKPEIKTNAGLGTGNTLEQVEFTFPDKFSTMLGHRRGFFLVYPSQGLIFNLDTSNVVWEWAVFGVY